MGVYLMPQFVVDLQSHGAAHFAKRVLRRTIQRDGTFRVDHDDHRYHGVAGAWIRYVGRGRNADRVIFIRSGADVYLYRAGGHDVEARLTPPPAPAFELAVPVAAARGPIADVVAALPDPKPPRPPNRLLRNRPGLTIGGAIMGRRNLPHRDIWLVTPFITPDLLLPTAEFGRMLFQQAQDGASIALITTPPGERDIGWLERVAGRDIGIWFCPRLHTKLYCFVLDENRRYERGLPDPTTLSSLLIIGSANMTLSGLGFSDDRGNEELCYSVPDTEIEHVETYVTELMLHGFGLDDVRAFRARGQEHRLESDRW